MIPPNPIEKCLRFLGGGLKITWSVNYKSSKTYLITREKVNRKTREIA